MTEARIARTRRSLTTPRAAAVAGIVFALLFGTSIVLIRMAVPAHGTLAGGRLTNNPRAVSLALNLLPYAGIAFLWFVGVIRDRLGEIEDRFFATVFLGSGFTFLALVFATGALSGGLLTTIAQDPAAYSSNEAVAYGRAVVQQMLNLYAIRMAGVFMMSLATIWLRSGLMHRGWAYVTIALALILLISIAQFAWMILIFPGWVLAISIYYLVVSARRDTPVVTQNP